MTKEHKKNNSTYNIAMCGVLTALAMIFSYIESIIPVPIPVPGIKLGVANIAVITILYTLGIKEAVIINILRISLTAMLFGNLNSFLFSIAGAVLSMVTMIVLKKIKQFICPHCGEVTSRDGVIIYVDPIFIKRCEIGVSQEEGYRLIEDSEEISNQVKIMGTLCREPQLYENPKNKQMECDFQIASNRNRHILEDNPEKRTDYPWVKAYGKQAVDYYEALHVNSTVYIDGALQARSVKREFVCEKCGEVFEAVDSAIDIIPYNLEYLKDCSLPGSNSEEEFEGGGDENGK